MAKGKAAGAAGTWLDWLPGRPRRAAATGNAAPQPPDTAASTAAAASTARPSRPRPLREIMANADTAAGPPAAQSDLPILLLRELIYGEAPQAPTPLQRPVPEPAAQDAPASTASAPAATESVAIAASRDLGLLVRQRREALNLSQSALAQRAGVGRRFLSELENGKATLEIGKVLAVLAAANLRLAAAHEGPPSAPSP